MSDTYRATNEDQFLAFRQQSESCRLQSFKETRRRRVREPIKRDPNHLLFGISLDQYSLKGIWLLSLLYFGSLASGAVISLIVFKLTHFFDTAGTSYLAQKSFPDFFDRGRWLSVLLILPYLFAKCKLTSWRAIGFTRPIFPDFKRWFAIGVGMIALIYGFNTAIGAYLFAWDSRSILANLPNATLASLLVGYLEEIVFRGLVFRMFYTAVTPIPAIILSSLFFAILHFNGNVPALETIDHAQVGFTEAAQIAFSTAIAPFTQFDFKHLLAIFLVGILLHQVFLLSKTIWANIALHAGWVFTIKLFGSTFTTTQSANSLSGTTNVADGYWVSIVLVFFVAAFAYRLHKRNERPYNSRPKHQCRLASPSSPIPTTESPDAC